MVNSTGANSTDKNNATVIMKVVDQERNDTGDADGFEGGNGGERQENGTDSDNTTGSLNNTSLPG